MNSVIKKRNTTLDVLRGFAIFYVIFGHIIHIEDVRTFIWAFHMPLFFFISGLLFDENNYIGTSDFLKKKAKSILLPYVLFYLMTLLYWIAIERHTRGGDVSIGSQLLGLVYGTYDMKYMMFNGALWFLPCLFTTQVIYWFLCVIKSKALRLFAIIVVLLAGLTCEHYGIELPWGLRTACNAVFFFGIACMWKERFKKIESLKKCYLSLWFVIGTSLQVIVIPISAYSINRLNFGDFYCYMPIAFIGITTYYALSSIIKSNNILEWLGINSLVLFAFQEPVYRAVLFASSCLFHIPVENIRLNFGGAFIVAVISIICIVPLVYMWNKWGVKLTKG